jgi:UDP-glucose 4-epimerase
MNSLRVAISGASSFSAVWIAEALKVNGFTVAGLCSSSMSVYAGIQKKRLDRFRDFGSLHYGLSTGSPELMEWIREYRPNIWFHHFHFMENFRSENYDYERAVRDCVLPVGQLLEVLQEIGCRAVVYSGTSVEPKESGVAFHDATPYARSKERVWEELEKHCAGSSVVLSKVVVPNPIGPLENRDRLIPQMISNALNGKILSVIPDNRMKNVSVFELAEKYQEAARLAAEGTARVFRPTSESFRVDEWTAIVNTDLIVGQLKLPPCKTEPALNSILRRPSSQFTPTFWKKYSDELNRSEYRVFYGSEDVTNA